MRSRAPKILRPATETEDEKRIWYTEYQGRELDFARERLGHQHPRTGNITLWAGERAIVKSVFANKKTIVRGARGTSKSHAAGAVAIPTFFYTRPSTVLSTAPTLDQVKDITLSETWRTIQSASDETYLAGAEALTPASRRLVIDDEHKILSIASNNPRFMKGRHAGRVIPGDADAEELSPEDEEWFAQMENVKGDRKMLLVIDEAESVSNEAMRMLEGMIVNPNVTVLAVMNPYRGQDEDHWTVKACKPGSDWHSIKLSLFPEDAFPDPIQADEVFDTIPYYITTLEARKQALKDYDPQDPIFRSDWLGQFAPGDGKTKVIPRPILEAALITKNHPNGPVGPRAAFDIGETQDPTYGGVGWDGTLLGTDEFRVTKDDREAQVTIATWIASKLVEWGRELGEAFPDRWDGRPIPGERTSIDCSGMVGVGDILASKGVLIEDVNFGAGPSGQWGELTAGNYFKNQRAEMHWVVRRGLQEGCFRIPEEFADVWEQAGWANFTREAGPLGPIIVIEPKDDIRERYKRSPDAWDMFMLLCREVDTDGMFATFGSPHMTSMGQYDRKPRQRQWKKRKGSYLKGMNRGRD